jgi:hypothetical protein
VHNDWCQRKRTGDTGKAAPPRREKERVSDKDGKVRPRKIIEPSWTPDTREENLTTAYEKSPPPMKISLDSDDYLGDHGPVIAFRLRAFVAPENGRGIAQLHPLNPPPK